MRDGPATQSSPAPSALRTTDWRGPEERPALRVIRPGPAGSRPSRPGCRVYGRVRRVWEPYLYGESAVRAELGVEAGVVRGGDRADDGQAEAVAAWMGRAVGGEPLEGLEELLDLVGRHGRTGVGDCQQGVAVPGFRAYLDGAAGQVVPDRVVDQVGGHPFGQVRVALHGGMAERDVQPQPAVLGLRVVRGEGEPGDVGQVEGLSAV